MLQVFLHSGSHLGYQQGPSTPIPVFQQEKVTNFVGVGLQPNLQLYFALALFRTLGYNHHPHVVRSRLEIRLLICGEYKYTKPDVCIIDRSRNDIVLLVQVDKRFGGDPDPFPQLVAEGVA